MMRKMTTGHPDATWLSEYLDDELRGARRRMVRAHLAWCDECRGALEGLRQVRELAKALDEPSVPDGDLWPGIAARLTPRPGPAPRPSLGWQPAWRVPRLATAAVMLAVCLVGWTLLHRPAVPERPSRSTTRAAGPVQRPASPAPGPARRTAAPPPDAHDRRFEQTVARLQREAETRLTHDPHLVEVLGENLATLDVAIANYRDALAEEPDDVGLRYRLLQTRAKKLEVLRQAVALAAEGTE